MEKTEPSRPRRRTLALGCLTLFSAGLLVLIVKFFTTDRTHFVMLLREGGPERRWQLSDDPNLLATARPHYDEDFRLRDVEVWRENGELRYAGVYDPLPNGKAELCADAVQPDGAACATPQLRTDRCLTGFEAWESNGKVHYASVYRHGACGGGEAKIELGLDHLAFESAFVRNGSSHRLVDFEVVVVAEESPTGAVHRSARFSGLWHPAVAAEESQMELGLSWEAFHNKVHDYAKSRHLVDVEVYSYGDDSSLTYAGLWSPGGVGHENEDWLGVECHKADIDTALKRLGNENPKLRFGVLEIYELHRGVKNLKDILFHGSPLHEDGTYGPP